MTFEGIDNCAVCTAARVDRVFIWNFPIKRTANMQDDILTLGTQRQHKNANENQRGEELHKAIIRDCVLTIGNQPTGPSVQYKRNQT